MSSSRWNLYAMCAVLGGNFAIALTTDVWFVRAISMGFAVMAAGVYGFQKGMEHWEKRTQSDFGWMPTEITWARDDDGTLHAFVTQASGEPQVVEIPEEYAGSPQEAITYLLECLAPGEPVD